MFNSDGASVEKDEDNDKPEPGRSLRKLDQNLQGDDDDICKYIMVKCQSGTFLLILLSPCQAGQS